MDDSATLRQVLDLAAAEIGIRVRNRADQSVANLISGLGFYHDGDEIAPEIPWGRTPSRLPVIDEHGRLSVCDFRDATLAGLSRASAARLVDGDVLRPYLRLTIPQGTPTTVQDWIAIIRGLESAWAGLRALEPASLLLGVAGLPPVWNKLTQLARSLGERKVGADDLKRLLARRGLDTGEAAKLLGMTEDDAAEFLTALFYERDGHGLWRATRRTPG
jgi:hypothetical protein